MLILLDLCVFTRARLFPCSLTGEVVSAVSILVGLVMLLVPALAWMQYQWLGQLSEAERERMQRTLRTAAAQFATEFDTELSRTLDQPPGRWRDHSRSELDRIRAALFAMGDQRRRAAHRSRRVAGRHAAWHRRCRRSMAGTPVPTDRLRIRRWNPQAMTFEAAEWPDDLQKVRGVARRSDSSASRCSAGRPER